MPQRHVAFFRNLNLGQRGSPTREQLVTAFRDASATDVSSFQANGTIVFRASAPQRTVDLVRSSLSEETDWRDVAPVRAAGWVLALVEAIHRVGDHAEVSLYDTRSDFPVALPWRPDRGRVTVVRADRRHAVSVNDQPRTSFATPTLEALLGVPVTSRGLSTVQRLAARLR
jgi:uncharacterized protein (DUF1697 family)